MTAGGDKSLINKVLWRGKKQEKPTLADVPGRISEEVRGRLRLEGWEGDSHGEI